MKDKVLANVIPVLLGLLPIVPIFLGENYFPLFLIFLIVMSLFGTGNLKNLKKRKKLLLPYISAILIYIFYTILSPDFFSSVKMLERQISLLAIPLTVFGFGWGPNQVKTLFIVFVFTLLGIGVYSLYELYFFIQENREWINHMGKEVSSRALYVQYKFPHIIHVHPTYWSYLLISGITIILGDIEYGEVKNKKWHILIWALFSLNLFYLAARTPIVIYSLIHLFFLINLVRKGVLRKWFGTAGIGMVILILLMISRLPLLKTKIEELRSDERTEYWSLAAHTIKKNYFVLGEGFGESNKIVRQHVIEKGDPRDRYKAYDLHNQYLRHYVDMGLLGILSLLFLIFGPTILGKDPILQPSFLTISFILLFSLALFTESYLIRLKGIVFFSVFSSIILVINRETELWPKRG